MPKLAERQPAPAEAAAPTQTVAPVAKPKDNPVRTGWLSGWCGQAERSASGVVAMKSTPEQWHDRCRGSLMNGNGTIQICRCDCHADHPVCRECGRSDVELFQPNEIKRRADVALIGTCKDVESCVDEIHRRATASADTPLRRQLAECQELGAAARLTATRERNERKAADAAREAAERGEDPEKAYNEPTPARGRRAKGEPQRCHEGCGQMTKGGQFAMGHDMRLKGRLFEVARSVHDAKGKPPADVVDAAAEVVARGWNQKGIAPVVLAAAEARLEAEGYDALIERRVRERYDGS